MSAKKVTKSGKAISNLFHQLNYRLRLIFALHLLLPLFFFYIFVEVLNEVLSQDISGWNQLLGQNFEDNFNQVLVVEGLWVCSYKVSVYLNTARNVILDFVRI